MVKLATCFPIGIRPAETPDARSRAAPVPGGTFPGPGLPKSGVRPIPCLPTESVVAATLAGQEHRNLLSLVALATLPSSPLRICSTPNRNT